MSMAADRLYRNASGNRDDSDISSIWERKQIGIIKVQHAPCKFISLLFLLQLAWHTYVSIIAVECSSCAVENIPELHIDI